MFKLPDFHDRSLLQLALTHRSYINEHPDVKEHNERLEFLGDAVLNFLSGEFLYKHYPEKPEGELTPLRSALVDEQQLAKFAIALQLGDYLRLGKGAEREGGRQNPNLLSSAFEAIVGAYFLDTQPDVNSVRIWVEPMFHSVIDHLTKTASQVNYKSRLQEWSLAKFGENPKYLMIDQSGPDHAKQFKFEVQIMSQIYGEGKGSRKQDAEKAAAKNALERLGLL